MRRVGGRMRNRELALNYAEWCRNYRGDVVTMWQNRNAQLTMELETLQMKFMMTTQVPGRVGLWGGACGVRVHVHVCVLCVQACAGAVLIDVLTSWLVGRIGSLEPRAS